MRREVEAIGTNAHELPMVYAALADTDEAVTRAPYQVLADWQEEYEPLIPHQTEHRAGGVRFKCKETNRIGRRRSSATLSTDSVQVTPQLGLNPRANAGAGGGLGERNLRIILPDTFGTHGFFEHAPDWVAEWAGVRVDSGDPVEGAEAAIAWWRSRGEDPSAKVVIFSDGLDVDTIEALHTRFRHRVKVGFGWGTLLTNDFRGLMAGDELAPFSLVCKVTHAEGRPAVKISDTPGKALGPAGEVARYKRIFGVGPQVAREVLV